MTQTINKYADTMLNKISQCIAEETKNLPTLSGAKVSSVNTDGTINVYFPPDDTKIFTNINNQTPFNLQVGDSVELLLKDGSYNNCWIVAKHQDTFTGKFSNGEDIENLVSTAEIDPVFASSPAYLITEADISKWDRATSVFPSSTVPKMDGTATVGTETSYARGDHIHPTDTTRQAKITASGILKGDGDGTVTSAVAGTDYAAASHTHNASAIVSGTLDWDVLPTARIYDATASRTANTVLAAPNGSAGPASFRALVAADIPSLNYVPKVTSTDNAIVRFNGTAGTVQNSTVTIDDTGNINAPYDNNFISHGNEFNIIPTISSDIEIHINHRQRGSNGAGRITKYHFKDGAGTTLATISSGQFSGNAATATSATSATTASKANAANITTTKNSIAIYTDTAGTFNYISTANGAAYATGSEKFLTFGTLPVAQGGTGLTASPSILINLSSSSASNIMQANPRPGVTGTLPVENGGTSTTSFTANSVIMSGSSNTAALTTRAVTNNTATSTAVTASTNIPTMNTLRYAINRTTSVAAADTGYTTLMARGMGLRNADTNPGVNGAINWTYE